MTCEHVCLHNLSNTSKYRKQFDVTRFILRKFICNIHNAQYCALLADCYTIYVSVVFIQFIQNGTSTIFLNVLFHTIDNHFTGLLHLHNLNCLVLYKAHLLTERMLLLNIPKASTCCLWQGKNYSNHVSYCNMLF